MTLTRTAQRILIVLFFAAVAVVYGFAWMAPAIGVHGADSTYLVTARSLLAGHGYTVDSLPAPIPQTTYPPVFPMFLAMFAVVSGQSQWLKLLPVVCTAGWLLVTYKLLRKMGAESWSALLLAGVTAASPAVVFAATNLFPASLFGLLAAGALLAFLDDRMLLAGALAGFATLTQAVGVPLIAACALTLVVRGRFRRAIVFTGTAVILAAPWFAWAMVHGGNFARSNILTHLAANEKVTVLAMNTLYLFGGTFSLLSGIDDLYAALVTFILLVWCLWKRRQLLPDLFILLYCGLLLFRTEPPQRSLVPVLPLILWLFWRAIRKIRIREAVAAVVLLVALLPLLAGMRRIPATLRTGEYPASGGAASGREPNDWKQMAVLFEWIRTNTPRDAILAANSDSLVYLNSGRETVRGFTPDGYKTYYQAGGQAVTPDQLTSLLAGNGVSYVALTPDREFAESAAFHKAVEALERGGLLEPVAVPGLGPDYRLLRTSSARLGR